MKDINGLAVAEADDLRPIIGAFARLVWPLPAAAASHFAEQLGWTMTREHAAQTTLAITSAEARLALLREEFYDVNFAVTDRLPLDDEGDLGGEERVQAAFAAVRNAVRSILGEPGGFRGGRFAMEWWNLDSGGRVHVLRLSRSVMLALLSKDAADLERYEMRVGISPDRV